MNVAQVAVLAQYDDYCEVRFAYGDYTRTAVEIADHTCEEVAAEVNRLTPTHKE